MSETTLKISEMTPDSNLTGAEIFPFIRGGVEDNFITTLDNIKEYFNIPTKVSQLENDSKYITQVNVPTNVGDFENNVGYITRDNATAFTPTGDYNPSTKKYVDDAVAVVNGKIPTKTSQLTNDSGFATTSQIPSVPSNVSEFNNDAGYVNESRVNQLIISALAQYVKSSNIRTLVKMTAAEYASSSKDANTAYFVTD